MAAPHILHSTDRNESFDHEAGTANAATVKRIALVAALAACALVTLSIQDNTASVRPAPALAGTTAIAAPGADDQVPLAPSATEYYFPALYTNQATSNDGNVMTYEHD